MGVYCKLPFTHIFSDSYGIMMPCCYAHVDHPYKSDRPGDFPTASVEDGILNYWKSPEMSQLRLDMMKGEMSDTMNSVCQQCIYNEKAGLPSHRIPSDTVPLGRVLDIKLRLFGNSCNLSCYMCNIKNSSYRISQTEKMMEHTPEVREYLAYDDLPEYLKKDGGFDLLSHSPEVFDKLMLDIKKLASKIKSITIIGGEPMILPSHYKVLDVLIESGHSDKITLSYDSNLTRLQWKGCKILDYFDKFKSVDIKWSIEGIGKYDEYIRFPTKWDTVEENFDIISAHPKVNITANTTIQLLSVINLDLLSEYLGKRGMNIKFIPVDTPQVVSLGYLHPNIRKRLSNKYRGTGLEFICQELDKNYDDWEERWDKAIKYLNSIDYVNGTNWKETFPELCDLSEDR